MKSKPFTIHRSSSATYRLRQLTQALFGRITAQESQFVADTLSPAELQLFRRMARFDQRHCLDVAQTLQQHNYADTALLQAALLHDIGKVGDDDHAIPLVYYGVFVVLQKAAPWLYNWAAKHGRGLFQPFALHANHEQRAVELARAAESTPDVIAILGDYAERRNTEATQLLAWADNLN